MSEIDKINSCSERVCSKAYIYMLGAKTRNYIFQYRRGLERMQDKVTILCFYSIERVDNGVHDFA